MIFVNTLAYLTFKFVQPKIWYLQDPSAVDQAIAGSEVAVRYNIAVV